jgi:hypothetical protein
MATSLNTLLFRGTRRIRLFFTGPLAAGAFTSVFLYAVTSIDGLGASPINVVAVFAIANDPNAVELAVDSDATPGGQYRIDCTAVPCADATLFTGSLVSQTGLVLITPPNVEPATDDLQLLLYNRDLLHDGNDFVEDASGDLAVTSGRPNWKAAMTRRMTSPGLPWDPAYSPRPDQYVDAPQTYQLPLAGALLAQARLDNRTRQASVDVVQSPTNSGDWVFQMSITGKDELDPAQIFIPPPG